MCLCPCFGCEDVGTWVSHVVRSRTPGSKDQKEQGVEGCAYLRASISPSHRGSSTLDPCFISPDMLPSRKPRPGTVSSKVHGTF